MLDEEGARFRAHARTMCGWVRCATDGDPAKRRAGFTMQGVPVGGSNLLSTFFAARFGFAGMLVPDGTRRLDAVCAAERGTPPNHFGDGVALLWLPVMTRNFREPTDRASAAQNEFRRIP